MPRDPNTPYFKFKLISYQVTKKLDIKRRYKIMWMIIIGYKYYSLIIIW